MIDYGSFQFASAPLTGEAWFIRAAQLAGFGPGFLHHANGPFPREPSKVLRVSLVRHPCDLLGDLWATGYDGNHLGKLGCLPRGGTFDRFIDRYLQEMPGTVGDLYRTYEADSVLSYADLPWAFIELVQSLGVSKELLGNSFFGCRPNLADYGPDWPRSLRREVCEAERWVLDTYDYW
jgi:hypothetical protein